MQLSEMLLSLPSREEENDLDIDVDIDVEDLIATLSRPRRTTCSSRTTSAVVLYYNNHSTTEWNKGFDFSSRTSSCYWNVMDCNVMECYCL